MTNSETDLEHVGTRNTQDGDKTSRGARAAALDQLQRLSAKLDKSELDKLQAEIAQLSVDNVALDGRVKNTFQSLMDEVYAVSCALTEQCSSLFGSAGDMPENVRQLEEEVSACANNVALTISKLQEEVSACEHEVAALDSAIRSALEQYEDIRSWMNETIEKMPQSEDETSELQEATDKPLYFATHVCHEHAKNIVD